MVDCLLEVEEGVLEVVAASGCKVACNASSSKVDCPPEMVDHVLDGVAAVNCTVVH